MRFFRKPLLAQRNRKPSPLVADRILRKLEKVSSLLANALKIAEGRPGSPRRRVGAGIMEVNGKLS